VSSPCRLRVRLRILICPLTHPLTHLQTNDLLDAIANGDVLLLALLFSFFGHGAFFSYGRDNTLTSLSLYGAYAGLESYHAPLVMALGLISNFAGRFLFLAGFFVALPFAFLIYRYASL